MKAVDQRRARIRERNDGGKIGNVRFHDYLGAVQKIGMGPQAYLAEQLDPCSEIYPHFHDVDQFQIVVSGSGMIGAHAVKPVSIHYADGYSPYGPIVAGPEGISYFTLRLAHATGGWKMPGNRHRMPGRAGRNFLCEMPDRAGEPANGPVRDLLWGPASDGLAIEALHLPDEASVDFAASDAGGAYILLVSGRADLGALAAEEPALVHLDPDDVPVVLTGRKGGAKLLLLRFARPSDRPGSDPARVASGTRTYDRP